MRTKASQRRLLKYFRISLELFYKDFNSGRYNSVMDQEYVKRFDEWGVYRKSLDSKEFKGFFHEREIWWCALGVNIGSEQDGKNENFERPALVFRKIKHDLLVIVPFTSKISDDEHRIRTMIAGRPSQLLLSQIRTVSSKRLLRKMGRLRVPVFQKAVIEVAKFLLSAKLTAKPRPALRRSGESRSPEWAKVTDFGGIRLCLAQNGTEWTKSALRNLCL